MKKHVTIIAEAGVNHNGSLENAKKLIDFAAEAGADFIKFQTFKTENLVSKAAQKAQYQSDNLQSNDTSQFNMLKKLELNVNMHEVLQQYANEKNIQFFSTAFDLESIDLLEKLNLPMHKIPSGEITNKPYLEKIAHTKKPVIISTGMANMNEIEQAINIFKKYNYPNQKITILHCNTQYPTPMHHVNLLAMQTIKNKFNVAVGYSDHTLGIEIPIAAVALGATVIEKHFTLNKNMEGPDHKASLEPQELKAMVKAIRNIETALGNGEKKPTESEVKNLVAARKSIHTAKPIAQNQIITATDLIMKRPGNGISPMLIDNIIGKKAKYNLPEEHLLNLNDLV